MKLSSLILLIGLLIFPRIVSAQTTNHITYTPSTEDFANPERGFMKQNSVWPDQTFNASAIGRLQASDSIQWIYFRLDNYRDKILDQNGLNNIKATFTTARTKNLKLIIRFIYNWGPGSTDDPNQATPDAPLNIVLQHISQIKPVLIENSDVIAVMQAGFVGHWGEWHSSKYLYSTESKQAILTALLDALPANRMLQLRYPRHIQYFYQGPLTSTQAFTQTPASRIGHHNDCFLKDTIDSGTYISTSGQPPNSAYCNGSANTIQCWKNYVAQIGRFTPIGGETCGPNPPRSSCPTATQELEMLHWSFINNEFEPTVLNSWKSEGCWDTIRQRLGYRLVLQDAYIPAGVSAGGNLNFDFNIGNVGYAAIYNIRPVFVVLQNATYRYDIPVPNLDPRRWESNTQYPVHISVSLPANIVAGTYNLGLWLPDNAPALRSNAAYSIRFANLQTWDATTGINLLTSNLQVSNTAPSGTFTPTPIPNWNRLLTNWLTSQFDKNSDQKLNSLDFH